MLVAALIFRRPMNAQNAIPYSTWLHDFDGPIVLFTLDAEPDDPFYTHVERYDSFDIEGRVEVRALELSQRFPFTHVFAQSEHDILRAAELRERLALPGQSYNSARAFRDKFYMKTLARTGGVEVAAFAALTTSLDLHRFVAEYGYPCIIKPRTGAGSRGLRVLKSKADLKDFLQRPFPSDHMVERFIEGLVFHVDGLMTDGNILFASASRYFNNCLSFLCGESSGSALLDPRQPLSRRLVAKTEMLLAALPTAPHIAFHAEFFLDAADRIVFCEVASRPGGSRTADPIEVVYRLNMYEQWVRRSFGLPIELPVPAPWFSVGRLMIPPRRGKLLSLPESVPFPWVIDYRTNSAIGQHWEQPAFSNANVASFILSGRDTEQVESRMHLLDAWFRGQVEWEEPQRPLRREGKKVK
jgi:hypothetical protein